VKKCDHVNRGRGYCHELSEVGHSTGDLHSQKIIEKKLKKM
jgi:hypothetical protein